MLYPSMPVSSQGRFQVIVMDPSPPFDHPSPFTIDGLWVSANASDVVAGITARDTTTGAVSAKNTLKILLFNIFTSVQVLTGYSLTR